MTDTPYTELTPDLLSQVDDLFADRYFPGSDPAAYIYEIDAGAIRGRRPVHAVAKERITRPVASVEIIAPEPLILSDEAVREFARYAVRRMRQPQAASLPA